MGNVERLPVRNASERVAVLLNANARSVSDGLKRELENFVPPEDLYYSRCFDDARGIAGRCSTRATARCSPAAATELRRLRQLPLRRSDAAPPRRLARRLEARPGSGPLHPHAADRRAQARHRQRGGRFRRRHRTARRRGRGHPPRPLGRSLDSLQLHLLSHEGKRAPFAGLGIDAQLLNDYVGLKEKVKGTRFEFLGTGGLGYFCSIAGRTIPAYALQRKAATSK